MIQKTSSRRGQTQIFMPVVGVVIGLGIGAAVVLLPAGDKAQISPMSPQNDGRPVVGSEGLQELRRANERLELELREARLKNELATLRSELEQTRSNQISSNTVDAATEFIRRAPQTRESAPSGNAERTLAFWNGMNDVIRREASMRSTPSSGVNMSNAGDFVGKRVDAYSYAVSAFDKLDREGVDEKAIRTAREVRGWYAKGLEISLQAQTLMNSDSQTRRGTAGLQWRAAEMKHNADVAAVNQQAAAVRKVLTEKYGVDFPELE